MLMLTRKALALTKMEDINNGQTAFVRKMLIELAFNSGQVDMHPIASCIHEKAPYGNSNTILDCPIHIACHYCPKENSMQGLSYMPEQGQS